MTKHSAILLSVLLGPASCALFGIDPDAKEDDSGRDSGNDSGADSGGGTWDCYGQAYTRTDDPGTALCMDGTNTFECAWGSGNTSVDGFRVEGDYDSSNELLTLYFPDNPEASSFTPFVFDVLYDYGGVDLVLEYQASRAGDYRAVASWNEAVYGDNGVCGGDGGAPVSPTCQGYCSSSDQCTLGEACLNSADGMLCLPASCQGCWDAGYTCSYFADTCTFSQCQ